MFFRWQPCWILIGETFRKAYLEDWQLSKDGQNYNPVEDSAQTVPCASDSGKLRRTENSDVPSSVGSLGTPHRHQNLRGKQLENLARLLGRSPETEDTSAFWEKSEAPLPHQKTRVQLYSPKAA